MPVSLAQLRRYVVDHQRYATRFRRARADDVVAAVRRLGSVQLDSISAVERSHRLALGARVGLYPRGTVSRLLGEGRIFEYWAHEACLLPVEDYPLYRWRMELNIVRSKWRAELERKHPGLMTQVLATVRERGALASRDFDGGPGMWGGAWDMKPAKAALELLLAGGELTIAGRQSFQRLYDLPERVLPRTALEAVAPGQEDGQRELVYRAVAARGALTVSGIVDHCRFRGGTAAIRPAVDALVAEGRIRRVRVDDGGPDVLVPADAQLDGRPAGAVLLSPFESLLWDRDFAERLFGFRHIIEVYKPEPERVYGYYVLPLLVGDRIVGRADLKSDRREGVLRLRAFHPEPGVRRSLDEPLASALSRLARLLELERIDRP
jgi:uncharacterized protein